MGYNFIITYVFLLELPSPTPTTTPPTYSFALRTSRTVDRQSLYNSTRADLCTVSSSVPC